MLGLLSVVATPIGNLEDITLRALRVLREAHLIAAEDTRHTAKLLRHHGIQTPTESFHAHNIGARLPQLTRRLVEGQHVALVTDAGTPGVSDPGAELVRASRDVGARVQAIPGANAPVTAAVMSGFPLLPLTVLGFPPHRSQDRIRWFDRSSSIKHTFTFFESPHRVASALSLTRLYLVERQIFVGRELTKAHEEGVLAWSKDIESVGLVGRGEFTFVVGPSAEQVGNAGIAGDAEVQRRFEELSSRLPDASRGDLVVELAATLGVSRREVYQALERAKGVQN